MVFRERRGVRGTAAYVTGMFYNRNAGDPTRGPMSRTRQQAINDGTWKNESLRLTWQTTPRNKFNLFWDEQTSSASTIWTEAHRPGRPKPRRRSSGMRDVRASRQIYLDDLHRVTSTYSSGGYQQRRHWVE